MEEQERGPTSRAVQARKRTKLAPQGHFDVGLRMTKLSSLEACLHESKPQGETEGRNEAQAH